MKKILIISVLLLITCGCEATYTINIDQDYYETTSIINNSNENIEDIKNDVIELPVYYDNLIIEEGTPDEDPGRVEPDSIKYNMSYDNGVSYSYKYVDMYHRSTIPNEFSESFIANYSYEGNSESNILASDFRSVFNSYENLTKLTINIKTNKKVVSHNADIVNNGTYTWIITKDNANRSINFYFENDKIYKIDDANSKYKEYKSDINNNSNSNNQSNNNNKSNNNSNTNNNTSSNNTNKSKRTILLYLLLPLFFILLFVIIKFRETINRK